MAVSNTTYEQTLGLITAITEVTRNANKAANALKTISQRLRGVGDDGEDATEYIGKLQEAFDKLDINTQIVKSDGSMESTYNILTALSEKWDDLSDAERQYIGELAAGKNRITEFNALMGNFEVAISATESAMNSAGSATKENEKVLDSIQGKINNLKSAWQNFARNTINSEFIKSIVDAGAALLEFADSDIGRVIIAVGSLATAYKLLTLAGTKLIASSSTLQSIMAAATLSFNVGASGATGFTAALKGTAAATKTLTATLLANPLFWGVAAVSTIVAIINHQKKLEQANLDLVSSIQEEVDSLNSEQDALSSLSDELISNYNAAETLKEKKETLTKYQEEIIDKYGDEIESLTEVKNANDLLNMSYEDTIEVLSKVEKSLLDKQVAQLNEGQAARDELLSTKTRNILGSEDEYTTVENGVRKVKDEYVELFSVINEAAQKYNISSGVSMGEFGISGNAEDLVHFYDEVENAIINLDNTSQIAWGKMKSYTSTGFKSMQEDYDKFSQTVQQNDDADVKNWIQNRWEEYSNYDKVLKEKQDLKQQYDNAETVAEKQTILDKIKELQPSVEEGYTKLYEGAGDKVKEGLDKYFSDFNINDLIDFGNIEGVEATDIDNLFSEIENNANLTDKLKNKILEMRDAIDSVGNTQALEYFDSQLQNLGFSINEDAITWDNFVSNIDSMDKYFDSAASLWDFVADQGVEDIDRLNSELVEKLNSGEMSFEDFFSYLEELISEAGGDVEGFIDAIPQSAEDIVSSLTSRLDGLSNGFDILNNAVDEFNNTGGISVETFKDLTDNNLLEYLTYTENGLIANTDALYSEADAAKLSAIAKLQVAYSNDVAALAAGNMGEMSDEARIAIQNEKNQIDGLGTLANAQTGGLFNLATAQAAVAQAGGSLDVDKYKQELDSLNSYYNRLAQNVSNISISTSSGGSSRKGSGSKSSAKSTTDEWKEAFEEQYAALKHSLAMDEITEKQYTDRLEKLYKKYFSNKKKYSDEYNKYEEEVYKNRKKLLEDEIDQMEEVLDKQRELTENKYENAISVATNAIDEQIEALEKQKEALEENNDETERAIELAKLQEELERAKSQKTVRVFYADRGWVNLCPII